MPQSSLSECVSPVRSKETRSSLSKDIADVVRLARLDAQTVTAKDGDTPDIRGRVYEVSFHFGAKTKAADIRFLELQNP